MKVCELIAVVLFVAGLCLGASGAVADEADTRAALESASTSCENIPANIPTLDTLYLDARAVFQGLDALRSEAFANHDPRHTDLVRATALADVLRGMLDDLRKADAPATVTDPGAAMLTPPPGTRVIYVASPPLGDDSNPGTLKAPVATPARGYEMLRDGFPDWLVVRRGDEFTMTGDDPGWHNWCKSGKSADERMVIGNYGPPEAAAPVIHTRGHGFVRMWGGGSHLLFKGFDARSDRSPGDADLPQEAGIRFRSATAHDVTFAGITLTGFFTGVEINGHYNGADVSGITLRRCVIQNSWAPASGPGAGHAQGLYATGFEGLVIEGCIFDHNGWLPGPRGLDQRTVFRHQAYLAEMRDVTIRGSVFADEAFGAIKVRSDHAGASGGILIEGNVFARSLFSIGVGGDPASGDPTAVLHQGITIRGNVFTDAGATLPNGQAWARAIGIRQAGGVLIEGNYLIDPVEAYAEHTPIVLAPDGLPHGEITVRGNVIGWGTPGSEVGVGPDREGIVVGGNTFAAVVADVDVAGLLAGEVSAAAVIAEVTER